MDVGDQEFEGMIELRSRKGEAHPEAWSELWKASVAAYNARKREENRLAWCEYHQGQAERLRRTVGTLIAFHEEKAAQLEDRGEGGLLG
jgi:hypothetical protein